MGVVIETCIKYPGGRTRMTNESRWYIIYIVLIVLHSTMGLRPKAYYHTVLYVSPRDSRGAPGKRRI
jgi:hypothetical protein